MIGSLLTAALLLFVAPQFIRSSSRIVRQGMLADPQILADTVDALRDAQYAPVLNANRKAIETPFGSSRGGAKPDVTLVEFFDYACPYCKASNPHIDRLVKEDPACAWSIASSRSSGPKAWSRHGSLKPQEGQILAVPRHPVEAGRPSPETIGIAARAAGGGGHVGTSRRPGGRRRAQEELPPRRSPERPERRCS